MDFEGKYMKVCKAPLFFVQNILLEKIKGTL